MRPVNLIPSDERRDKRPIRTGPIAYLLVGGLAIALGAVTLVVLTDNKISDREAEITDLQAQQVAAQARANELAPFAEFNSVEEQRTATVKSLADSRFDWERVMRELGLVIPSDVWLTELIGSVGGDASATTGSAATGSVTDAPSLTLSGCATGQEAVAGFLSALRDIDGVTRVGLSSSERPTDGAAATTSDSGGGGGAQDCRTRDFITKFEIVAAFDAVPTPAVPGAAPAVPGAAPSAPTTATPPTGTAPATPPTEAAPASDTGGASAGS